MTELMKQYEGELANEGSGELKRISDIAIRILDKQVEILQAENTKLKDQLRWRPVSEKPEKADMYFVECKPYTGCGFTIVTTAWFDGEKFPWHDVVKWLPIPPAPEGE